MERNMAAPGTCGRVCGWQLSVDPREPSWSQTGHLGSRDPALTQRGHMIQGEIPQLSLDIQLQHPGLIWSDRLLVLDWGESMNEVIHQPPDGTRCVRGIVWRNLDTGLPQSVSHLSVSSSWRKNVLELIFSPSAFRAEATVDDREVTFSASFQALCGLHSRGERWNAHFTYVCGPGLQAVLRRDKYNQTTFNMNEDKWRNQCFWQYWRR